MKLMVVGDDTYVAIHNGRFHYQYLVIYMNKRITFKGREFDSWY